MKIIPYFINHAGCMHQCVFCNQRVINGHQQAPLGDFEAFLTKFAQNLNNINKINQINNEDYQLAFFGGSFTALPQDLVQSYLEIAKPLLQNGLLKSIRISTRPDAIDNKMLALLKDYGVLAIELGVQSLDDRVLVASGRGHTSADVVKASAAILDFGFELGHQLMLGLPEQSEECFKETVAASVAMKPHTVRLYPVQVLKDTPLASAYALGNYTPLNLNEALKLTTWAVQTFRKAGIRVIKIGLQAHEALMDPDVRLAGAYHPAYGEWVEGLLVQGRLNWGLNELLVKRKATLKPRRVTVFCNPRECSQVAGLSKGNRQWLEEHWKMEMTIVPDRRLTPGELLLEVSSVLLALPDNFE